MNTRPNHLPVIILAIIAVAMMVCIPQLVNRRKAVHPLAVSSAAPDSFPVTISDNFGRSVTVARRPLRLISLAPSVTEILFAIGAGDRLAADTTFCKYPPEATRLPKVGGYLSPNIEKIVALKPDLVLCDDLNGKEMVDHLASLKITTVMVAPKSLAEVQETIRLIGRAVGNSTQAEQVATTMQQRRDAVLAKTRALPAAQRPRTLFLISMDQGLYSAGPGSYIDDFITIAGGKNIAASAKSSWPCLSPETAVAQDPEVILVLKSMGEKKTLTSQSALALFRAKPRWQTVTAVKQGRITVLDEDPVTLPGPRMVEGLEQFANALHPELFGGGAK